MKITDETKTKRKRKNEKIRPHTNTSFLSISSVASRTVSARIVSVAVGAVSERIAFQQSAFVDIHTTSTDIALITTCTYALVAANSVTANNEITQTSTKGAVKCTLVDVLASSLVHVAKASVTSRACTALIRTNSVGASGESVAVD